MPARMEPKAALWFLLAIAIVSLIAIFAMPPISQPLEYHQFAGDGMVFGVPNFWNVISNLPFVFVGIAGLRLCFGQPRLLAHRSWITLFAGVTMVAFGSTWYHLHPENSTLVWDRLPMAIGFMGLFTALLTEYADPRSQKILLVPLLMLGVGAVAWWALHDDLRLYVWVQFFPLMSILILLVVFTGPKGQKPYLWGALFLYMLAKGLEIFDDKLYALTGNLLPGHPLKHLVAAAGIYLLYRMIKRRKMA